MRLKVGMKVKWNDPAIHEFPIEEQEIQRERIYTIDNINGEIYSISDEYGEVETFANELVVI